MKLHVGDEVLIITGKDKGQKGKVEKILAKEDLVIVPGLNVYKRHKRGFTGRKGEIIEFAKPLSLSKLMMVCPNCQKPTRVGYQLLKDGEKIRICKKCKQKIDVKKGN